MNENHGEFPRYGRICQVNRTVYCSDRRIAKQGVVKALLIYLCIGFLWGIGVSATAKAIL